MAENKKNTINTELDNEVARCLGVLASVYEHNLSLYRMNKHLTLIMAFVFTFSNLSLVILNYLIVLK